MVFGVMTVEWGYLIVGPVRNVALFPLLLIFIFGAFSLSWRRIMWLTAFAIASLVGCVVALHATRPGVDTWSLDNVDLRFDLTNVLMVAIVLPALSLVVARLWALRSRLSSQLAARGVDRALGESAAAGDPRRVETFAARCQCIDPHMRQAVTWRGSRWAAADGIA